MKSKLEQAYELFDTYNQKDPTSFVWNEEKYPQEYFFALQLHRWVKVLAPQASEVLLLASRCQHLGRWEKPRSTYPQGKVGYLTWRNDLSKHHAQKAMEILMQIGYEQSAVDKVSQIIRKQNIKADAEVQIMENALCLVFLEFQYEDFHPKHDEEKVVKILRKSLLKMDALGHQEALKLNFSPKGLMYIQKAMQN